MSRPRVAALQARWSYELPSVKPYYAVKCNPDPKLLDILRSFGFGFDCASPRELSLMHPTDSVVYANPCKSTRDLEYAKQRGTPVTVIDSVEEIEKLHIYGYGAGALLRIRVDDTGSKMPFGAKFGAALDDVRRLAAYAKGKEVSLHGISFHVGSGSGDARAHEKAIGLAAGALELLRAQGHDASEIDIGGGFVPTGRSFIQCAENIRNAIRNQSASIRFIAEPGRFFATESQDLFVQVIGKKGSPNGGFRYTLDESLYGQFTNILFDHQTPRWIRIGEGERARGKGVVFGRTCDSLDVIARSDDMEELYVGDWLWFPHMGAYTTVTASEFNGFPKPPVFLADLPLKGIFNENQSVGKIEYVPAVTASSMLR
jgi:ornithine decarboxylase